MAVPRTNGRRGISRAARLAALAVAAAVAAVGLAWYRQRCCAGPVAPPLRHALSTQRPADFTLTLSASTGTVSPEYYYSYRLAIAPGGAGRVTVTRGYGTDGPQTSADFVVAPASMDSIWLEFDSKRLAETPAVGLIPSDELLIGGGSSSLTVLAAGATIRLESTRRIADQWQPRVSAFIDRVESQIPDSVRTRLRIR